MQQNGVSRQSEVGWPVQLMSTDDEKSSSLSGSLGTTSHNLNSASTASTSLDSHPGHSSAAPHNENYGKEKIRNLTILIRTLQKEVKSRQNQDTTIKTVTSYLQEEQEKNAHLKERNTILETAVSNLQNRLASCGQSISVDLEVGESYPPGINQEVFNKLVDENTRLKRNCSVDPNRLEESLQETKRLQQLVVEQQSQIQSLKDDNAKLHAHIESSPSGKDEEIWRLKKQLEAAERKHRTQDILCQSLSDHSQNLQQQLRDAAEQYQRLVARLRMSERDRGLQPPPRQTEGTTTELRHGMDQMNLTGTPASDEMKAAMEGLKAKNMALDLKLKEVVETNQKWQAYNEQRESFVRSLQQQLEEAKQALSRSSPGQAEGQTDLTSQQQQTIDRIIMQYKERQGRLETDKMALEDANRMLKRQLAEKTSQLAEKTSHLEQLKDKVLLQEEQIKVITEDFESERADRSRAQGKIDDMDQELRLTKQQLQALQAHSMNQLHQRRLGNLYQYQQSNYNVIDTPMPQQDPHPVFHGRGGVFHIDGEGMDDEPEEGEDQLDFFGNRRTMTVTTTTPTQPEDVGPPDVVADSRGSSSGSGGEKLLCPRCSKAFPVHKHGDLLEHMDLCCE